ncbi:MAG: alpha/beta hydrolase [Fibrobacteraceae bacterium]|nr:alpha/beta hydrolase [Fibrobacteraceae bacterium]
MNEKWTWLPDFGSDLSLWEDDLVNISPSADHSFVSFESLALGLEDPYGKIKGLANATHVVGWGLGAFLLLLNIDKRPKGQKWILLSPYASLCDEDSDWTSQNLVFMARQCSTTVDPTLKAFSEAFDEEFGEWQDDWMAKAKKMDSKALAASLFFLSKNSISKPIVNTSDIEVIYGRLDKSITPAQTLKLKSLMQGAIFRERPKAGHWPPMLLL